MLLSKRGRERREGGEGEEEEEEEEEGMGVMGGGETGRVIEGEEKERGWIC